MCLPNEKAYLITRGEKGELVDKVIPDFTQTSENTYNGCSVPNYSADETFCHGILTSELFFSKILTNYCRGRVSRPVVTNTFKKTGRATRPL